MANSNLTMSDAGVEFLKAEEAVIEGLYDDPSGYCTYGVGHLVHRNRCFLLAAAAAESSWSSFVKRKWGRLPYLDRAVRSHEDFDNLKQKGKELAKADSEDKVRLVDSEAAVLGEVVEALLRRRLAEFERGVRRAIDRVALTQEEFDALVSFAFNIGVAGFAGSTAARRINEGKYKTGDIDTRKKAIREIDTAIKAWNKSGGRVLEGLVRRREREAAMFLRHAREELERLQAARPETSTPRSTPPTAPFLMNELFAPEAINAPYCPSFPTYQHNPMRRIVP